MVTGGTVPQATAIQKLIEELVRVYVHHVAPVPDELEALRRREDVTWDEFNRMARELVHPLDVTESGLGRIFNCQPTEEDGTRYARGMTHLDRLRASIRLTPDWRPTEEDYRRVVGQRDTFFDPTNPAVWSNLGLSNGPVISVGLLDLSDMSVEYASNPPRRIWSRLAEAETLRWRYPLHPWRVRQSDGTFLLFTSYDAAREVGAWRVRTLVGNLLWSRSGPPHSSAELDRGNSFHTSLMSI